MNTDEKYMRRCFTLAKKGLGLVAPNPMVGAVIVYRDKSNENKIIGSGYHKAFGEVHAEVNAIASVKKQMLLANSTMYISLEPCSHFGKTPPCVDLIIEKKIPRIVIATMDSYSEVSGKGIERLKKAGVSVTIGVLEEEGRKLNETFFHFHEQHRPFISLKIAQTIDGKIATSKGKSKWITTEEARGYGHILRANHQAILVSSKTVLVDNPSLTVRSVIGQNPIRIVLDRKLKTTPKANVYANDGVKKILITSTKNIHSKKINPFQEISEERNLEILFVNEHPRKKLVLDEIINELINRNIQSILIESGSRLSTSFLKEKLIDKIYFFIAPKILGEDSLSSIGVLGIKKIKQCISLHHMEVKIFSKDMLVAGYVK